MGYSLDNINFLLENVRPNWGQIMHDTIHAHFTKKGYKNIISDKPTAHAGSRPDLSVSMYDPRDESHEITSFELKSRRKSGGGKQFRFNPNVGSPLGQAITTASRGRKRFHHKDIKDFKDLLHGHVSKDDILIHGNETDGYMVITKRKKGRSKEAKKHNAKIDKFLKQSELEETHSYHDKDSFFNIFNLSETSQGEVYHSPSRVGGGQTTAVRVSVHTKGADGLKEKMEKNKSSIHS
jgi:hypothetical protein